MWFNGEIQQALNNSRNDKLMLLIFVRGNNEDSNKMNSILEDEKLIEDFSKKLIALRLDENSDNAKMFGQIYPITTTPTIYFVASDAKTIETFTGFIEKDVLVQKINDALNFQENNICNKQSLNEKHEKAQELIKEIRVKKAKEEQEKAKVNEKERIRTSKEIQLAKELYQQKEMENLIKERNREQLEAKKAREEVLRRIKQDQEERKSQFKDFDSSSPKKVVISTPTQITSDKTRIQFRLPDSSILKNVFNINDTLKIIFDYIESNTSYRNFKLATAFPKKEFENDDLDKKLVDLNLAPSAVIILKSNNQPIDVSFDRPRY